MPKNKRLLKMLNETGVKQLVQRVELDVIADRKLPTQAAADARTWRTPCTSCSTRRATRST